jgi:hypothetical protein
MWGSDAIAFLSWINDVTAEPDSEYRLADPVELAELFERGGEAGDSVRAATHIWSQRAQSPPELWTAPGARSPVTVSGAEILSALESDVDHAPTPWLLLSHAVRLLAETLRLLASSAADRASEVVSQRRGAVQVRLAEARKTLKRPLQELQSEIRDSEIAQGGEHIGPTAEQILFQAREDAERLPQLLQYAMVARPAPDSDRTPLTMPDPTHTIRHPDEREFLDAAQSLRFLVAARARAAHLAAVLEARGVGVDAAITSAHDVVDLVGRLGVLPRAAAEAHSGIDPRKHQDPDLYYMQRQQAFDRATAHRAVQSSALRIVRDLGPLTVKAAKVAVSEPSGPIPPLALDSRSYDASDHLGAGPAAVIEHLVQEFRGDGCPPSKRFAAALLSEAGIAPSDQIDVPLDSLAASVTAAQRLEHIPTGVAWLTELARRTRETGRPVLLRAKPPSPDVAGTIRLNALLLAAHAIRQGDEETAGLLRLVAAGVTLMQDRHGHGRPAPETLLVAAV